MSDKKFRGTGVALVTPFDRHGEIDFESLEKVVDHVTAGGVKYLVVLGTTAETPTLSNTEKNEVVKTVLKRNKGKLPVVLGKGGNNTTELVKNIESTDFEGVDAILSVAPWYNKPNQEGIYRHFSAVAEASPVPVILYNVPGRTSSNVSSDTCLRLAGDYEGKITGIKEASGNFKQIMEILAKKPESFHVISGDDAITLPMISLGGSGVISVTANAFPEEFSSMVSSALEGNYEEARTLHLSMLPVFEAIFAEGNPAGVKAFMKLKDLLDDNLRLPLIQCSDSLKQRIKYIYNEMNAK